MFEVLYVCGCLLFGCFGVEFCDVGGVGMVWWLVCVGMWFVECFGL